MKKNLESLCLILLCLGSSYGLANTNANEVQAKQTQEGIEEQPLNLKLDNEKKQQESTQGQTEFGDSNEESLLRAIIPNTLNEASEDVLYSEENNSADRDRPNPHRVVRYRINQTKGPFAPSCAGNPVYPNADRRCCRFGRNALCYVYTVSCQRGERLINENLRCVGYTNTNNAVDVSNRWGFFPWNRRGQSDFACEKLDGRRGNVSLRGFITCESERPVRPPRPPRPHH